MTEQKYHCGCGAWMRESCAWYGPLSELVVVEYMDESIRSSHMAAGNQGSWPHNGSARVAVTQECVDRILPCGGGGDADYCEDDDCEHEWASIVNVAPAEYAETEDDE